MYAKPLADAIEADLQPLVHSNSSKGRRSRRSASWSRLPRIKKLHGQGGFRPTAALAVTGEFGNKCAMSLANGKDTPTDCSISDSYKGKTYCFGSP